MVNRRELADFITRRMRPLERRVLGMARRFVLASLSQDGAAQASGSGLGEDYDGADLVEPYGFTSRPAAGADGVMLFIGGASENPVAWVYDRRHRPKDLLGAEVSVYNAEGAEVRLKATGEVTVYNDFGQVTIGADGTITSLNDGGEIEITPAGAITLTTVGGSSINLDVAGNITLTPGGAGKVKVGGAGAVKALALWPDIQVMFGALCTAIAALPGLVYAVDIVPIKAAFAALATALTANPGATKGTGV